MIRSLLDLRLSRLSLAVLACLSGVATVVILTGGGQRTPAQVAALAALRQPARAVAQAPVVTTVTATTPAPSATSDAGAGETTTAAAPRDTTSADSTPASSDANGGSGGDTTATATASATTTSTTAAGSTATATATSDLPKVSHVFEIALSTTGYAAAFGKGSAAPYLRSLERRGTLLRGYESLGRGELADYLAMTSGQAPDADTSAGCATFAEFPHGVTAKANGDVPGNGCVYPETALTLGDQVSAKGRRWGAYVEDEGTEACAHPNSDAAAAGALPGTGAGYDVRHNPFVYFHSLLDLGDCATDDVDLSRLPSALAHGTPELTFIAPGICADADPPATASAPATTSTTTTTTAATSTTTAATTTTTPTTPTTPATPTCPPGQPSGIAAEDAFLSQWVPRITASRAYKDGGVLLIAFAGVDRTGHPARAGALVLSGHTPRGKAIATAYRPYSLLRSVEDMLGFTPLAHANPAPSFTRAVLAQS